MLALLLFRFPEHEIQWIFFLIFSGYQKGTFTRTKIIQILVRKLTVIFELSCTVIYGTILLICKSFINQRLDHIYHTADFFRRKRILGCRFDIHTVHIFFTLCNVTFGNLIGCHPFFDGFLMILSSTSVSWIHNSHHILCIQNIF